MISKTDISSLATGRDLITRTLRGEAVERVPWVPFVGCHAASLLGMAADEFLRSADAVVEGQRLAAELYRADGIPVMFDLQIEAEALGCPLVWAKDNPPAVSGHICAGKSLDELVVPSLDQGRIPMSLEATRRLRKDLPNTALYGLITGPFTLAMHLAGAELFVKMFDSAEYVRDLLSFCCDVAKRMSEAYVEAGCDVIAVVDPMTSQIGPEQFTEFVHAPGSELFEHIRRIGSLGSFFVCGHAEKNIEVMCRCRPDNISVDENIPLDYVRDECRKRGISFGGNMRLTTVLLMGTPDSAAAHAAECMQLGGQQGFVLAPGCDLPYDTPRENLQAVAEVIHDPYRREVAAELAAATTCENESSFLDFSGYGRSDQVIVDIITLDSESCAPCQYMVESVREVAPEFEDLIVWREHKIKKREGVEFMMSMMVRNVPTICIDGQIKFVSVIPPRDELIQAIQERINKKLKTKIRRRQTKVTLLGGNCDESERSANNIRQAICELGSAVEFEQIDDEELARSFGAKHTPAVLVTRSQLKSSGEVPDVRIVKEWIKDL